MAFGIVESSKMSSWFFSADDDDEDENLLFSPALMARRASESWIDTAPIEVPYYITFVQKFKDFIGNQNK